MARLGAGGVIVACRVHGGAAAARAATTAGTADRRSASLPWAPSRVRPGPEACLGDRGTIHASADAPHQPCSLLTLRHASAILSVLPTRHARTFEAALGRKTAKRNARTACTVGQDTDTEQPFPRLPVLRGQGLP